MGRLKNNDLWDDEDDDKKAKNTRRQQKNEVHNEEEESENEEELSSVEEAAITSQRQSLWQWLIWCGAISAILLILSATLNYMFITACVFGLMLIFIPFGLAKATLRVEHGEPTEDFGEGSPFVAALLFPIKEGGRYPQLASISGIGLFTILLGVILSAATKHTGFESTAVAGDKNKQVAQNNQQNKTPPGITPPVNPLPPVPKEDEPKIPDPVDNGKKDFPNPKDKEKDPDPVEQKPFPPKAPPLPKDWKGSSETGIRAFFDFDEEKGDTCFDIGPEKLEATLHGCKRVPGRRGGAIELNGTTDFVSLSPNKSLDFAENAPFTVTMWIKTESNEGYIFSCRNKPDNYSIFNFFIKEGKANMWLRKNGNPFFPTSLQSRKIVNDNKWHHLAFSRTEKGEILLYVDGDLDAKGVIGAPDSAGSYISNVRTIGTEAHAELKLRGVETHRMKGCIDELGIYGEALGEMRLKRMINAK